MKNAFTRFYHFFSKFIACMVYTALLLITIINRQRCFDNGKDNDVIDVLVSLYGSATI
jgi:hypothetical protein